MREGFFGVVRTQFLHGGELWQNISSSGRSPSSWRPRLLLPDEPSMGLVPNPIVESANAAAESLMWVEPVMVAEVGQEVPEPDSR